MENVRLITNDKELLVVAKVLFLTLKENAQSGKFVIFLPWKFVLPEAEIKFNGKKKNWLKPAEESTANFSFEAEVAAISQTEALRLLGVILYHLVSGKSEYTHESYLLDGYRRILNSDLWPIISSLVKSEVETFDQVETALESINPDELKNKINTPPADKTKDKVKQVSDTIRELAKENFKVIGHEAVANAWDLPVPTDVQIRYSEASLREAIAANANGEQWTLVYYSGQNPRQMRDKIGVGSSSFYDNDWWLKDKENFWATKTDIEPGYYLLNFKGQFADKTWDVQEELINKLGSAYERAHEFVVKEAVLSNFRINHGERLLENWYHWGKEIDSGRYRVDVGYFGSDGFFVGYGTPSSSNDLLRVVVARKFDF
jgi:hypothetical protein